MSDDRQSFSDEATAVGPESGAGMGQRKGPRWLKLFLGRELLRACPYARGKDPCEGCRLRVLCRCAQENLAAATAVERRVWVVLSVCGAAAILYAAYSFFLSR